MWEELHEGSAIFLSFGDEADLIRRAWPGWRMAISSSRDHGRMNAAGFLLSKALDNTELGFALHRALYIVTEGCFFWRWQPAVSDRGSPSLIPISRLNTYLNSIASF